MEPGDARQLIEEPVRGDAPAVEGHDTARPEVADRGGHLGFVAHEIRNPLSTALWTAELLARLSPQERGGARGEKLSAMCLRSISRVRQLVEDHFLCERLDAGGLTLRVEACGVREVVDAVLERRPSGASLVEVRLDPSLAAEVDRSMLERVVDALVAVAGAERTPLSITARTTEREIALIVTGRPADVASMSDPVKGAPSDPTGRALALPLARRIAEALGGALAATDGGWCLSLPRARSSPRPANAAGP